MSKYCDFYSDKEKDYYCMLKKDYISKETYDYYCKYDAMKKCPIYEYYRANKLL